MSSQLRLLIIRHRILLHLMVDVRHCPVALLRKLRPVLRRLDGQDTADFKAKDIAKMVANVPAEPGPLFGTTVMELVMLGRYPFVNKVWWETPEDEKVVREALKTFGLDQLRRKAVALCSSGEKQRALIAKAYVQEPKLMLVDEPTSHLDMKYKLENTK